MKFGKFKTIYFLDQPTQNKFLKNRRRNVSSMINS